MARQPDMSSPIAEKVVAELSRLSTEQQQQVLDFARALAPAAPTGVPGRSLLQFSAAIPPEDIGRMKEAIEEGCEQVNLDEW